MTLTKTHLPHHEYRGVLMDLRDQLFRRFIWVTLACVGLSINFLLMIQPRPLVLLGTLLTFMFLIWQLRRLYFKHQNLARYTFVGSLYFGLFVLMWLHPTMWLAYLIMPVLLMSALLMSNSTLIGTITFCAYALWIHNTRNTLDIHGILAITVISYIVIYVATSAFNVALSWYSLMHHRAQALLQETRDRRAELVRTLKSLETAYQTQFGLQQQLIHARQQAEDARQMKERFASNISHELRTPLNIILGFSEIMHLTPEVYGDVFFPPKLHRDIYQIHHNSKHLLAMIDDVLDLSHIEMSEFSLNFEATDINEFLTDTVDMLRHYFDGGAVAFLTDIPHDLPKIDIDRTRIRQVLINLITNARRFTDAGYVKLSVRPDKNHIAFAVEDTGHGIAPDKMDLIFEEFYQVDYSLSRQHGGTGLGLAITKQFVEAHRGVIHVTSDYGSGSIFTFLLPIPERRPRHFKPNHTLLDNPQTEQKTVLLVDSDPHTESMLSRHIEGVHIVQVKDEGQLAQYVIEHQPAAIIHNRLSEQNILPLMNTPIIECTLPSSQWLEKSLNVAMSFAKPIQPQQIRDVLRDYPDVEKILIVDDEIGFVQLIQRSIEQAGDRYTIRRAYDGLQAYDIIQQDMPDLIFLDLAMPEMTGTELIAQLHTQEHFRQIPIVLLTATRYLQTDEDALAPITIRKAGGLNLHQTLAYLTAIINPCLNGA